MKQKFLLLLVIFGFLTTLRSFAQCSNDGTLTSGDLTPPGVGLSTTLTYGAGQYVLAFVNAGASYSVNTCSTSSFDTQLTVFDDATGTLYAYNDDWCGLQSNVSFTAPTCGYVRILLKQYYCNSSGLSTPVQMTQNTAGFAPPVFTPALADVSTCPGVSVTIGNDTAVHGGAGPHTYMWSPATGLNYDTVSTPVVTTGASQAYYLTVTDSLGCKARDTVNVTVNPLPVVMLRDSVQCGGTITLDAGNAGSTYFWSDSSTGQTLTVSASGTYAVTVTSPMGCVAADTATIAINPLPVVNLGMDTTQCGGSVTLDAGNAGMNYMWSDMSAAQTLTVSASGTYAVTVTNPSTGCMASDTIMVTINPVPVVSLGMDTTQCGGTIALDAGNAGSTYLWNDSTTAETIAAAASGMYSVTVTNPQMCAASDTINVTINPVPVVSLGMDTAQCGGTITLDAGNAGSTYLWNDSTTAETITAAASGMYSVTVTNPQMCAASDTINVTINSFPVVNLGADTVQCAGNITLDAGNAGMNYLWSDMSAAQTLTVSASGTYGVTVTNPATGCAGSDSIDVTIYSMPFVNLGSDIVQCGGSVMLDAGNAGDTYLWSEGSTTQTLTTAASGTYSVTVTNGTCNAADTISVTINPLPTVSVTPLSTCSYYAPITLNNGLPAGGNYSGTGVIGGVFDPASVGDGVFVLTYVYTDTNSCSSQDTTTITVSVCAGIEENSNMQNVSIYPNPASDVVNIEYTNADFSQLTISIMNIQGKEVYSVDDKNIAGTYHKTISTAGLSKGIYYIRLVTGSNAEVRKLVIR